MKSLFAFVAAVAVISFAQASFAFVCPMKHPGGRGATYEPTSAVKSATVKTVKSVK